MKQQSAGSGDKGNSKQKYRAESIGFCWQHNQLAESEVVATGLESNSTASLGTNSNSEQSFFL